MLYLDTFRIEFRQSVSKHVVIPVYRAAFIAMQVRPVARESDEVPHRSVPLPLLTVAALFPYDMIAGNNGQF
jgi:hypothetical protein